MAKSNCLTPKSGDVIKLAKATGLDPVVAAAKIGTLMDLFSEEHFPVEEEFKDYLGMTNNVEENSYAKFKTEQEAALEIEDLGIKTGTSIFIENYENTGAGVYEVVNNENEDIKFNLIEKSTPTETPIENTDEVKEIELIAKDIFNIKEITISNSLDKLYRPEMRVNRVNLIAREFSRYVTDIQRDHRPNSTRQEIIMEVGIKGIYDLVKEDLTEWSQDADTFTDYQRAEFEKIVDNFDLLIKETPRLLADHEDVDVKYMDGKVAVYEGDETEDVPESLLLDGEGVVLDNEEELVKDGWMVKLKHINPTQALSQQTRKILMEIPKLDFKGVPSRDDLDMPIYLDSEVAHGVLIEQLSGMTKSSQMLPILRKLAVNKPWINSIVVAISEDLKLHSMFYQDFRKVFMSYWTQIRKKMADGSYTYMTKELNKPDEVRYFLDEWRAIMESKTALSFNSVYDEAGNIDRDNLKIVKATVTEMVGGVKGKSIEEITAYVNDNIGKIKDVLGSIGVDTNITALLEALLYLPKLTTIPGASVPMNHMFPKMLDKLVRIVTKLTDNKATHLDFINAYENDYKGIAEILKRSMTQLMKSSVYENLKSYYSYTAPSYMLDLMNKLKGTEYTEDELLAFYQKEYGQYNWFYSGGLYRNSWIRDLATDAKSRELIRHKVVLNYNKKEYSKLSPLDHTMMMINEYYSDTANKVAWYPMFILADAPSAEFIKFHKYTDLTSANWENTLLDGFYEVAMLEYDRIKIVRNRADLIAKGWIAPIDNFETRGLKFQFLPFLNNYIKLFDEKLMGEDMPGTMEEFKTTLKEIIKLETDALYEVEKKRYDKIGLFEKTKDGNTLKHLLNLSTRENAEKELRNYFWNQRFALSQMLQITTTDIAYYKDLGDVQKRMKQIHTPGLRLDTSSEHGRAIENTVFLKDFKSVSNSLADIKEALGGFVKKGSMTAKDRDYILTKYSDGNVEVTDAQAYRSLSSYRAIMDMSGLWTTEMDKVFDKLKAMQRGENVKFEVEDFNVIWQPKKPFVYTQVANQGLVVDEARGIKQEQLIRTPIQNKNAEFLLIFSNILKKSPLLTAIEEFMEENDIDVVLFSTAVKVGGLGALDVHEFTTKEAIKGYLLEAISSSVGRYNPQIVHSIPYEDYALVQPMPSHYMDVTLGFGTQVKKLVVGDLKEGVEYIVNGKVYDNKLILKQFNDLNVENLLDSFYKVCDRFEDRTAVLTTLMKEVNGSKRYNPEMAKALEIAEDGYPVLPLSDLVHDNRTQSMNHSIIKNEVTKQLTKGGSLVLVTSWGVHDDLNIKWGTNPKGEKYIEYIEAYMPWYSSNYFKELMDPKTGLLDVDAVHKNLKDKNGDPLKVLPEELRKLIGYRIPTEHKYSMFPIYIKGFLPSFSGGTIMLPKEITTIAGIDFDADKLYAMFHEFSTTKRYDRNKFVTELMENMELDPKDRELFKAIHTLTYKEELTAEELKDTESNAYKIFNSWLLSKDLLDENGESRYFLGETIEKIKYDDSKSVEKNGLKARNNQIIDIMWGILTNPDTVLNMINPGGFDGLKKAARVVNILNGLKLSKFREFEAIAIEKGFVIEKDKKKIADVTKYLNSLGLKQLSDLAEEYKEQLDPLSPSTLTYFHKLNHTAAALIGIFANHNANHALVLNTNLAIKKGHEFKLGGKLYTSLHEMLNAHKQYISRNTSEPVSASVDAVKDPVLSDLNLNSFTADLACFLLRQGHTHGTMGLFLSLPIVILMTENYELWSDSGTSKNDIVKKTIEEFFGTTKFTDSEKDYKNSDLSQHEMARAIVYGKNMSELTDAEKKEYFVFQQKIANMFKPAFKLSGLLARIVSAMRGDTSGGSTGPHDADTNLKRDDVEDLMKEAEQADFPFTGAQFIKVGLLKNKKMAKKENISELRSAINSSIIPLVQANYTLGLETSELLLSQYYPYALESYKYVVSLIKDLTKRFKFSKGSLTSKLVKLIYSELLVYIMSELEFFGGKSARDAEIKRDHYINKFPDEFERIKKSNKEIGELDLIKGLTVITDDKGKGQKIIVFNNVGSISPNLKDSVTRDWDSLLSMGDEAKKLAMDLFAYSYFRNGFAFGPTSFIHLAPVSVRLAVPGYRRTLIKLNLMFTKEDAYRGFINQFLVNHRNVRKFVPEVNEIDDSVFMDEDKALNEVIQILTPKDESRNGQLMVRTGVSFPVIMKKLNGVEYYYKRNGESELIDPDTYITQYTLIDNPIGIPNKFLEYQNGLEMEAMESQIDPKYKGYEEEDTEGPESMPMEGFENETPPMENIKYGTVNLDKYEQAKLEINKSKNQSTTKDGLIHCIKPK